MSRVAITHAPVVVRVVAQVTTPTLHLYRGKAASTPTFSLWITVFTLKTSYTGFLRYHSYKSLKGALTSFHNYLGIWNHGPMGPVARWHHHFGCTTVSLLIDHQPRAQKRERERERKGKESLLIKFAFNKLTRAGNLQKSRRPTLSIRLDFTPRHSNKR